MGNLEISIEKLCSFYVSDWHLVTMILPYINKKLNEEANIITLLESNIEENIKIMIEKLNLKNEEKILKIDWKNTNGKKYDDVLNKLEKITEENNITNIILINGGKTYIDFVSNNIEKVLKKLNVKSKKISIKIINCYEVSDFNGNIKEILDEHHRILNTAGEKNIEEIFEGYSRKEGKIAL